MYLQIFHLLLSRDKKAWQFSGDFLPLDMFPWATYYHEMQSKWPAARAKWCPYYTTCNFQQTHEMEQCNDT